MLHPMPCPTLYPLDDKHIQEVLDDMRARDKGEVCLGTVPCAASFHEGNSLAYALVIDGKTIAIGGFRELWSGTGDGWLIASSLLERYPVATTKAALTVIRRAKGFRRLQCTVKTDFNTALSWIEMLGFHVEGKLEAYDFKNNDHFMYARINEDK